MDFQKFPLTPSRSHMQKLEKMRGLHLLGNLFTMSNE